MPHTMRKNTGPPMANSRIGEPRSSERSLRQTRGKEKIRMVMAPARRRLHALLLNARHYYTRRRNYFLMAIMPALLDHFSCSSIQ
jgi:hypothetical protein